MVQYLWTIVACSPGILWPFFILYVAHHSLIKGEALTAMAAYLGAVVIAAYMYTQLPRVCDAVDFKFTDLFIAVGVASLSIPILGIFLKMLVKKPSGLAVQPIAWLLVIIETLAILWKISQV